MDEIVAVTPYTQFIRMSALLIAVFIHVVCGLLALYAGCVLLFKPKQSSLHKRLGYLYVVTLTLVDLTGLAMYAIKGTGIHAFHFLAIGNLIALYGGLFAIIFKRPLKRWYRFHYYMISWSYVGLVTATLVEILVKSMASPPVAVIALLCVTAVVCGGSWIELRTRNMGNTLPRAFGAA